MKPQVKKYSLKDPRQDLDEKEIWKNETMENKIHVLEILRKMWIKMNSQQEDHGGFQGLRRVFHITKQT